MEKIVFSQNVLNYFDDLILTLFYKDYFIYEKNAQLYVDKIVEFVHHSIENFPSKIAPKELIHLGSKYIFYKANSRTIWYVFFEEKDERYIITAIINSHSEDVKYL